MGVDGQHAAEREVSRCGGVRKTVAGCGALATRLRFQELQQLQHDRPRTGLHPVGKPAGRGQKCRLPQALGQVHQQNLGTIDRRSRQRERRPAMHDSARAHLVTVLIGPVAHRGRVGRRARCAGRDRGRLDLPIPVFERQIKQRHIRREPRQIRPPARRVEVLIRDGPGRSRAAYLVIRGLSVHLEGNARRRRRRLSPNGDAGHGSSRREDQTFRNRILGKVDYPRTRVERTAEEVRRRRDEGFRIG